MESGTVRPEKRDVVLLKKTLIVSQSNVNKL